MSGHSKWSKVKHQKAITDVRKGKIFSKMAKMIAVAARKGGDPDKNPSLRIAIEKAREVNTPKENIERAIKKGSGKDKEGQLEEAIYEAYGPEGIQLIIEVITDNKNRTISELRHTLNQHNGRLAEEGSVKWNFSQMGVITTKLPLSQKIEEIELALIDAGAEDIKKKNNIVEIYTKPNKLEEVKKNLKTKNIIVEDSGLEWIAKSEIKIENETVKKQLGKLFESLDENEDIKEIYSNVRM